MVTPRLTTEDLRNRPGPEHEGLTWILSWPFNSPASGYDLLKRNPRKNPGEENCLGQGPKSPHGEPHTRLGFGRAASGGAIAPEPWRSTGIRPEYPQLYIYISFLSLYPHFFWNQTNFLLCFEIRRRVFTFSGFAHPNLVIFCEGGRLTPKNLRSNKVQL